MARETEAEGEEPAEGSAEACPGQRSPPGALADQPEQTQRVQVIQNKTRDCYFTPTSVLLPHSNYVYISDVITCQDIFGMVLKNTYINKTNAKAEPQSHGTTARTDEGHSQKKTLFSSFLEQKKLAIT